MKHTFKYILIALVLTTGLSSCGLFRKSCNCPTFGMVKAAPTKGIKA